MAPDVSTIREQISTRLPRVAEELQALIRNSIRLKTTPPVDEALLPVGTSKFGGLPDLPEEIAWPEWNGAPLAFIAQCNLEEVAPFDLERLLPTTGILYFFYDAQLETWGDDPKDKGGARVLYYDSAASGTRRTPYPETLHEWGRDYPACRVELSPEVSMPSRYSMYITNLDLTEEEAAVYRELIELVTGSDEEYTDHRLLGYASPIQNDDMEEQCAVVTHALHKGTPVDYQSEEAEEVKKRATDWQLLLQVDSDDNVGMMWGDAGSIYYFIKREDLARRNFDDAWLVLQCY